MGLSTEALTNKNLSRLSVPARTYKRREVSVQPLGSNQKDGFILSKSVAEKAIQLTQILHSLPPERQSSEVYARREKFVDAARDLTASPMSRQIRGLPSHVSKGLLEQLAINAVALPGLKPAQVNEVLRVISQEDQTVVRPIQQAA